MGLKDTKLLFYLDYDARCSLADLSKKLNLSKQNINYKIKKLEEQGIIEKYVAVVDIHKLGFLTYRAYLRLGKVTNEDLRNIERYLTANQSVLWLVSISGTWDYELVFVAKNYIEFDRQLSTIKEHLQEKLVKYNLSMSIVNLHYKKDYLIDNKRDLKNIAYYGYEPKEDDTDILDKNILLELSENCRRSNQEIGKKLEISHHTVKARIQLLEKRGIIQSYRSKIHIQKLGYKHMKAALYLYPHTEKEEKELATFLSSFPNVTYVVKILGEWGLEIEAEVKNEDDFSNILRIVRNKYPLLINDYYTFQVTRELKLNYFPNGRKLLESSPTKH
ncbi:Lrp/AsnC family transcriptional regulator [Candidatus Woesearchaeota archaeon]|nr:Lrp/AsnC family transcriptional regulator [Candidatus Woesearchaeota archaeon]